MMSIKAIVIGTIATSVIYLCSQLIFVLVAGYSGMTLSGSKFWVENKELIWKIMGLITLLASMSYGGVVVNFLIEHKRSLHGFIAGTLTTLIFYIGTYLSQINIMSVVMMFLGFACVALAAHYRISLIPDKKHPITS